MWKWDVQYVGLLPFVTCLGITERHLTPSLLSLIRYLCTLERSPKSSFKAKQSQLSQALPVCQILQSSLSCLVLCWTLSERPSLLYCRAQSWAQYVRCSLTNAEQRVRIPLLTCSLHSS